MESFLNQIEADGFATIPAVFSADEARTIAAELGATFRSPSAESAAMQTPDGAVYGARNVLSLWPPAACVWRQAPLPESLLGVLGPRYGLVRVLFFDKPPEQTWSLPWHKDLTIAVQDNRLPSHRFTKPTRKAGVPHVEAPEELLEQMVIVRVHLDAMTDDNGPLRVIPGSHRSGKSMHLGEEIPHTVLLSQGDVFVMRPLLTHSSVCSRPDCESHRSILHFEFASLPFLPDGYAWHDFVRA
jgi:hypothetical protein